jgi:MoxR-like ATPase
MVAATTLWLLCGPRSARPVLGCQVGASPRGGLALVQLARGQAVLNRRDYVVPDDIKQVAVPALAHRVTLRPELWVRQVSADDVVAKLLSAVPTPKTDPSPKTARASDRDQPSAVSN